VLQQAGRDIVSGGGNQAFSLRARKPGGVRAATVPAARRPSDPGSLCSAADANSAVTTLAGS